MQNLKELLSAMALIALIYLFIATLTNISEKIKSEENEKTREIYVEACKILRNYAKENIVFLKVCKQQEEPGVN